MPRIANFADVSARLQPSAHRVTRPVCMMWAGLQCCAIVISAFVCATPAIATSEPALRIRSGSVAIQVGQQNSGQPLRLHGVFEGFNPATHRLKLAQLDPIAFSWEDTMRDVEVDTSVSMNALEPGMAVTATLTRKRNGQYYVSGLKRS